MKTLDEMIAVMERALDGAQIQHKYKIDGVEYGWYDTPAGHGWDWNNYDFRVKPVMKTLDMYIDPAVTLEEAITLGCVDLHNGYVRHRTKKVTITWEE